MKQQMKSLLNKGSNDVSAGFRRFQELHSFIDRDRQTLHDCTDGIVFSSKDIYEHVWEEIAYNCEKTVAVHIRRIREKIEINSKDPKYLKVVWGIGYKIEKIAY